MSLFSEGGAKNNELLLAAILSPLVGVLINAVISVLRHFLRDEVNGLALCFKQCTRLPRQHQGAFAQWTTREPLRTAWGLEKSNSSPILKQQLLLVFV